MGWMKYFRCLIVCTSCKTVDERVCYYVDGINIFENAKPRFKLIHLKRAANIDVRISVGWLFWALRPFETVFQSISSRLPERGRKKREKIDERKNVQTTSPCPTFIQISRTPRHWKFTQHHRSTRPPPAISGDTLIE